MNAHHNMHHDVVAANADLERSPNGSASRASAHREIVARQNGSGTIDAEGGAFAATLELADIGIEAVHRHTQAIQHLLEAEMVPDLHYGVIPGTQKPTLYQAGAQKIAMMFALAPHFEETVIDFPGGHREVRCKCTLTHRGSGAVVAQGVGSCTTMESRYRYRSEQVRDSVPREYWDRRDPEVLGGPDFEVAKRGGRWVVVRKRENPDPSDYYNTISKMAAKRAFVHAVNNGTGAGDIFIGSGDDGGDDEDGGRSGATVGSAGATARRAGSPADGGRSVAASSTPSPPPTARAGGGNGSGSGSRGPTGSHRDDRVVPAPEQGAEHRLKSLELLKSGETGKGTPWSLHAIHTHEDITFHTLSPSTVETAQQALDAGRSVRIWYVHDSERGRFTIDHRKTNGRGLEIADDGPESAGPSDPTKDGASAAPRRGARSAAKGGAASDDRRSEEPAAAHAGASKPASKAGAVSSDADGGGAGAAAKPSPSRSRSDDGGDNNGAGSKGGQPSRSASTGRASRGRAEVSEEAADRSSAAADGDEDIPF